MLRRVQGPVPRRLLPLRLYYAMCFFALGAYAPYFPRWLEARGIVGARMGTIAAALPAMGILGPPLFGMAADALALRGALLRVACGGALVGMVALGASFALGHALGFGGILAAVLLFSFFRSPMILMADVVALEQIGAERYARSRLWGSLGFFVAALLVGRYAAVEIPEVLPAWIAGALLLSLISAWRLPTKGAAPPVPALREARALLGARDFQLFLAASFLGQTAHSSYDLCFTLHLRDLGITGGLAGLSWDVGVVAEVILMALSVRLFQRFSAPVLLAMAFGGAALRWALLGVVTSLPAVLVMQPLHALSFALMWIASLAWVKSRAPAGALGTAQGLFSATTAAGSMIGMPLWGALYRARGGGTTYIAASLVAAAACVTAAAFARSARLGRRVSAEDAAPA
jgi:MFS transporter, PPP family, 3-phenylpropionic acid transporter